MEVLIVSLPGDVHARAVRWALERAGKRACIVYPLDLAAGAEWTYDIDRAELRLSDLTRPSHIEMAGVETLWLRRLPIHVPLRGIRDLSQRAVCEAEMEDLILGVLRAIEAHSYCVNPSAATLLAERKPGQLAVAQRCGMTVPNTLVTNSLEELRAFFAAQGGEVVYKPLRIHLWDIDGSTRKSIAKSTPVRSLAEFERKMVQQSPAMYQQLIPKRREVRVIVMGATYFAWCACAVGAAATAVVDWGFLPPSALRYETVELPLSVREQCRAMLKEYGLVFGCFDFIIDEHGRYIFLELNSAGQFLYGEELDLGLPLLDAFVHFLIERDAAFVYRPGRKVSRLADYVGSGDLELAEAVESHFGKFGSQRLRVSLPV